MVHMGTNAMHLLSFAVCTLFWAYISTSVVCLRCTNPYRTSRLCYVMGVIGHTRRQRYTGKYPRSYTEKYKETSGDEATIAKVTAKGGTAAGQHRPVMLDECLHFLGITHNAEIEQQTNGDSISCREQTPQQSICVDCTLGYGGHSREILTHIAPRGGVVHAIDQDGIELAKTTARLEPLASQLQAQCGQRLLYTKQENFGNLLKYTDSVGVTGKVSAILCDLGYSSMQIDNPARGFSYKHDGPLDMRMYTDISTPTEVRVSIDQLDNCALGPQQLTNGSTASTATSGAMSAHEYLCQVKSVSALAAALRENSDVENAVAIALALLGRDGHVDGLPRTTLEFANRVRRALEVKYSVHNADLLQHKGTGSMATNRQSTDAKRSTVISTTDVENTIARCMQAIRIEVNAEFRMLDQLLAHVPLVLAPKGRIVFLTFHSGEDRRVKKALKAGAKAGIYVHWGREVVVASKEERFSNPRSKCAKLRWATKA